LDQRPRRAFLVGAQVRGEKSLFGVEDSLDELERLTATAGVQTVGRDWQNLERIHPATYIGSGKVQEITAASNELGADLIIFDDELSPAQLRNLERLTEMQLLDRTALILDIFAMHARTREGALQVELAQYDYRLPRLTRQWTHLSRQAVGGVGLRGPGETQLEVDRREISRRMARLRDELEEVRRQRGLKRRMRRRRGLPVVAIVGYTNAGKSTLLNRLSGAEVLVEDKLFATLDPTTRRVDMSGGKQVLFTDTVGFIQKLPTQLVAAFRATLEEVHEADIILHVADAADPQVMLKIATVEDVLRDLGIRDKPMVLAFNKIDLVDPEAELSIRPQDVALPESTKLQDLIVGLLDRYDQVVPISAEQGVGIDELLGAIQQVLLDQMVAVDTILGYTEGDLLATWRQQGAIEVEDYKPQGVHVKGRVPRWLAAVMDADEE
jgi:GTPase